MLLLEGASHCFILNTNYIAELWNYKRNYGRTQIFSPQKTFYKFQILDLQTHIK